MLTYQTNIWEGDWRFILSGNYLSELISRCKTDFQSREVIVNNVNDRSKIQKLLEEKVDQDIIDTFYFVEDFIDEVLDHFDLTKDAFEDAYYVSTSELVGIYLCKTKFLLYFKGDSHLYQNSSNWIAEGIQLLNEHKDILVANPTWNSKFEEAKSESFDEIGNFHLGYGFSDQCFLVRTEDFRQRIYNETHPSSKRYPRGNPFEAMVNSYMRNHELKRITHKTDCYRHDNFKSSWIYQKYLPLQKRYVKNRLEKEPH